MRVSLTPYELYQYIHPSEVGTSLGSGMGGKTSLLHFIRQFHQHHRGVD